jgi:hypothetical protein
MRSRLLGDKPEKVYATVDSVKNKKLLQKLSQNSISSQTQNPKMLEKWQSCSWGN